MATWCGQVFSKNGSASWGPLNIYAKNAKQTQKTTRLFVKLALSKASWSSCWHCTHQLLLRTALDRWNQHLGSLIPGVCRFESLQILAHLVKWWLGCIITSETKGFRFYCHSQKVIGFVWIFREYVVEHAKTELSETICLTLLWHTMTWYTACVHTSLQVWICNHGTKQRTWLDRKLPTPRDKDQTHSIQRPACQR